MRRFLRFVFILVMSALSFVPLQFLFAESNAKRLLAFGFPAGVVLCIIICFMISKKLNKDEPILFWIMFVTLLVCLVFFPVIMGLRGQHFFSNVFFDYVKDITFMAILIFWYMVSILVIKRSQAEIRRQKETSSERELRRARERRDPALDIAERERLNKMLASMPEKERQELLKKQAEYEAKHNKG